MREGWEEGEPGAGGSGEGGRLGRMSAPEAEQGAGARPTAAPASEGVSRVRVRYSECDPMGFAHHGAYAPWLEIARTELLRTSGVSYGELERTGVLLAVTRLEIRFRQPARYDDEVDVAVRVTGGGRARIDHTYEVRRVTPGGAGDTLLATAESTLACIDGGGRPRALPEWMTPERTSRRKRGGGSGR